MIPSSWKYTWTIRAWTNTETPSKTNDRLSYPLPFFHTWTGAEIGRTQGELSIPPKNGRNDTYFLASGQISWADAKRTVASTKQKTWYDQWWLPRKTVSLTFCRRRCGQPPWPLWWMMRTSTKPDKIGQAGQDRKRPYTFRTNEDFIVYNRRNNNNMTKVPTSLAKEARRFNPEDYRPISW